MDTIMDRLDALIRSRVGVRARIYVVGEYAVIGDIEQKLIGGRADIRSLWLQTVIDQGPLRSRIRLLVGWEA